MSDATPTGSVPDSGDAGADEGGTERPALLVLTTGGTISMLRDPEAGGAVPTLSGEELVERVPGLREGFRIEVDEVGLHPGPHMTPERMWALRERIARHREVDPGRGIVVTHGTDTLEETAYLLDRTLDGGAPVVLTGAMRNAGESSWDGPMNLMNAARVATAPSSRDRGALVVLERGILQGRETVKVETESGAAFRARDWGPLGEVDKRDVLYFRDSRRSPTLESDGPAGPVDLVKAASGADARLLDASLDSGALGVVVEGFGRGNVPPGMIPALRRWTDAGRPVVVTSRCLRGRVLQTYAYEGGGAHLREMGVAFAEYLTGQQARMELIFLLSRARDPGDVRAHFRAIAGGPRASEPSGKR